MSDSSPVIRLKNEAIGYFDKRYEEGHLPILNIWLSGRCNFGCLYCATDAGKPDKYEISAKHWQRVVSEAKALGADTVSLNGRGEPLMDRRFRKVADHIFENKMRLTLSTNGSRVSKKAAKYLFENPVDIVLKMPTFDPEVFNALACNPKAYDQARRGLDNLMEAGFPSAAEVPNDDGKMEILTRLSLETFLIKPTYETTVEVLEFCKEHSLYPMVDSMVAAGRACTNNLIDEWELSEEEERELYREFERIFGYQYEGDPNYNCPIRMGIFIDNQGVVRADSRGNSCDVPYPYGAGNINEPLESLWETLKEWRERSGNRLERKEYKPNGLFPKCYRMAEAEQNYRDFLDSNPSS